MTRSDRRVRRLLFDISVDWGTNPDLLVKRVRGVGVKRIVYASDQPATKALAKLRTLPLSAEEFRKIDRNVAPYMK